MWSERILHNKGNVMEVPRASFKTRRVNGSSFRHSTDDAASTLPVWQVGSVPVSEFQFWRVFVLCGATIAICPTRNWGTWSHGARCGRQKLGTACFAGVETTSYPGKIMGVIETNRVKIRLPIVKGTSLL